MRWPKHFKFALSLLVLLVIIAFGSIYWFYVKTPNDSSSPQQSAARNVELERQYEKSVKEILTPFWAGQPTSGIRQQLLDLRAPALYLNLHINLVLAFDLIEQGQTESDQAKIESGLDRLNGLAGQYAWLK